MALVTVDEAKAYLKITTAASDAILATLVTAVTDFMKNTCLNRNLESVARTQLYDGNGMRNLMLDEFPIISVAKLSQSLDHTAKTFTDLIVEGTEFFSKEGGFLELLEDTFILGQRTVFVSYTAGFATIPGDIKDMCNVLIAKRMQNINRKDWGITTKNVFDDSVSFDTGDLTPAMKKTVRAYRKRPSSKGVDVTGWTEV